MRFLLLFAALQSTPNLPPADEIVTEAVQTTLDMREQFERVRLKYTKVQRVYDLSKNPPRLKESKKYRMWYENGESWQRLIEENGGRVTGAEKESPGIDAFATLPRRYEYSWADPPVQNDATGKPCYVLVIRPHEDGYEAADAIEQVLSHMYGTVWIDRERRYVRFVDAELRTPIRVDGVKGVGKVFSVRFQFSQRPLLSFIVFGGSGANLEYTILDAWFIRWPRRYERHEVTYEDFEINGYPVPNPTDAQ